MRDPSKPTDGLRRVDKVNRTSDSSNGSSRTSVTRSDSSAKARVTRTDSIRSSSGVVGSSSPSISASSRKAVTAVSSPRTGKKLIAGSQPVGSTLATGGKGKTSPAQNSSPRNPISSSLSSKKEGRSPISSKPANSQQARSGNKSQQQPKSSSASNLDVKPDVIADIEQSSGATEEDVRGDVEPHPLVFPPHTAGITEEAAADDEAAPELVTAKLIRDMRGEENEVVTNQQLSEVAGDAVADALEKCDDNNEETVDEAKSKDTAESVSRRESVEEVMGKKSIIVNVEEVEMVRKESVTAHQRDEIQKKKKSLMELEAESPYLRKRSLKETTTMERKTSLASKSYMRKESVKEQLEALSDNQYFTKQALNNATSTTINQVIFDLLRASLYAF